MDLELKSNAVFSAGMRAPPRRYSKHQAEEVHRQLAILLKADIVEPCVGEYARRFY